MRPSISRSVGVISSMEMPRFFRWVLVIIFSMEFLSLNPLVYLDVKLNHLPPFLKDSIVWPFSCSILYMSRWSSIMLSSVSQPMCLKRDSIMSVFSRLRVFDIGRRVGISSC